LKEVQVDHQPIPYLSRESLKRELKVPPLTVSAHRLSSPPESLKRELKAPALRPKRIRC